MGLGYLDAEYSVTGVEGVGKVERASAQRGGGRRVKYMNPNSFKCL